MTEPVDIDGPREDAQVRIGEIVASAAEDVRLVAVGLGSCVGVAVMDPASGAVALAHVFLPEPPAAGPKPGAAPGTYAAGAVEELVRRVTALSGVSPRRLVAVIAGGAKMFASSSRATGGDVGERNVAAVEEALAAAGVSIVAKETGGTHGRTVRVAAGSRARVGVRVVGQAERDAWSVAARETGRPVLRIAA